MRFFSTQVITVFLLASCVAVLGQTDGPDKSKSAVDSEFNLVHYGDVLEIDVAGGAEYDWRGTLGPEGFLSGFDAPIDPVFALCKTTEQIASEVSSGLSVVLRNPQVVVRIIDSSSRPLVILNGAVRVPQRFQLKRRVKLRELIILSGGLTEKSSGVIQIYRPSRVRCSESSPTDFQDVSVSDLLAGRPEADPEIGSGEVITILESVPIYVIGGVANPRQIASRSDITVTRAVAIAGGLVKNSDSSNVRIFRRKGSVGSVIDVDLEKIRSGTSQDVPLMAFDVVEVAEKGGRRASTAPYLRFDGEASKNSSGLPLSVIE